MNPDEIRIPLRSGNVMVVVEKPGTAYDTMTYSLETTAPARRGGRLHPPAVETAATSLHSH